MKKSEIKHKQMPAGLNQQYKPNVLEHKYNLKGAEISSINIVTFVCRQYYIIIVSINISIKLKVNLTHLKIFTFNLTQVKKKR